jgi:hypothetical protein
MNPPPYPAAYHRAHAALVAHHPNPRPLIAAALRSLRNSGRTPAQVKNELRLFQFINPSPKTD